MTKAFLPTLIRWVNFFSRNRNIQLNVQKVKQKGNNESKTVVDAVYNLVSNNYSFRYVLRRPS